MGGGGEAAPHGTRTPTHTTLRSLGLRVGGKVGDRLPRRQDLVRLRVRDLHPELLLQGHDQLHRVQGVQAQVGGEGCGGGDL